MVLEVESEDLIRGRNFLLLNPSVMIFKYSEIVVLSWPCGMLLEDESEDFISSENFLLFFEPLYLRTYNI